MDSQKICKNSKMTVKKYAELLDDMEKEHIAEMREHLVAMEIADAKIKTLEAHLKDEKERANGYFKAMQGYEKLLSDIKWSNDWAKQELAEREKVTAQKIALWCKRHALTGGTSSNQNRYECLRLADVLAYLNELMRGEVK